MIPDMILMLTSLDRFSWIGVDSIYAFPSDETDESATNGYGMDVFFPYRFYFSTNMQPNQFRCGYMKVCVSVSFVLPYDKQNTKTIHREFDLDVDVLREKNWNEFLQLLEENVLDHNFFVDRRSECEQYLLANPPRE